MVTGTEYLYEQRIAIQKGLRENQRYVDQQSKMHDGNIAFLAELFLEELLNAIYEKEGWKIINLNTFKPNHPAIDLADKKSRICFQITITSSTGGVNQKIKDTLTSFYKRGLEKEYDKLFIIFVSGIPNKSKVKIPHTVDVDGCPIPVSDSLISGNEIKELLDLEKDIFKGERNLERINRTLVKIKDRPQLQVPSFDSESYIPRVSLDHQKRQVDLIDYIDKERRVVLLGVGGWGKTTELRRITHEISQQKSSFFFYVPLINYSVSLENFMNARCNNWQNIPKEANTYFIFDGFDEIDSSKLKEVESQIKNFAVSHPEFKILVSCRDNFNPFEAIKDVNKKNDDDFMVASLKELSKEDIDCYITKACKEPSEFLSVLEKSAIVDIFRNPYYLVNAIKIFNIQGAVPATKAELFQNIVEERFKFQKKKDPTAWREVDEHSLLEGLKYLAIIMQYAGKYQITNGEFTGVIRDRELRRNIKQLFFHEEESSWRFEHNNLQEFLAAWCVSEMDWDKQKDIILLDNGKLKPKWLNAFSFLVNIVKPESKLVQYFIDNDIDSLVKTEPDKIDITIRNEVFKRIFFKHKDNGTIIWHTGYNEKDLYNFVELESNVEVVFFLIGELDHKLATTTTISNAVRILFNLSETSQFIKRIRTCFLELLYRKDIHEDNCSDIILDSFSKWLLFDKEIKDELIQNENLFNGDSPLTALCHYLFNGKFGDISGAFVHEIINLSVNRSGLLIGYSLFEVIRLLSHEELIKLIQLEVPAYNKDNTDRYWVSDLYKVICEQAVDTYHEESTIADVIGEFIYQSIIHHDEDYVKDFIPFYLKTGLINSEFKKYFLKGLEDTQDNERENFLIPAAIATISCVEWAIELFKEGKITDRHAWEILNSFGWAKNHQAWTYFSQKLNEITSNKFTIQPSKYELFNEKLKKLHYQVLMSHKLALGLIGKVFDYIGKDITNRKELLQIRHSKEVKHVNVELYQGLELIIWNTSNEIDIERTTFLKLISQEDVWEEIILKRYINLCCQNALPNENVEWIKSWCFENSLRIDLEQSYSQRNFAFVCLVVFYDINIPEQTLLKLTTWLGLLRNRYGDNSKNSNIWRYLEEKLDSEVLKQRTLDNLKNGIDNEVVLMAHLEVVKEKDWRESIDVLPSLINNSKSSVDIRYRALVAFEKWDGNYQLVLPALAAICFDARSEYFSWYLIEYLSKHKSLEVREYLKNNVGNEDIDQFRVGMFLTNFEDEEGYGLVLDNLTIENYYRSHNANLLCKSLRDIEPKRNIDFLMKLLENFIAQNVYRPEPVDFLSVVFEKFGEMILKYPEIEATIYGRLDKIYSAIAKSRTLEIAQYRYNELVQTVNKGKDIECDINAARGKFRKMDIQCI